MKIFRPSAAFQAFFDAVIAAAEAPVTPGSYNPTVPTFADPREQAFVIQQLLPLITQINVMKASVTPSTAPSMTLGQAAAAAATGDPAAQQIYDQLLWQQASAGAP